MNTLFLIPTPIHENGFDDISPSAIYSISQIRFFIVENLKTARRCLRKMNFTANFDTEVVFYEIDKHDENQSLEPIHQWMKNGYDIGVMSEAGLPCIADPGAKYVALAHQNNYRVAPLSGPSSIIMALISSGFNGQNFTFNGYLPIDKTERTAKLKDLEAKVVKDNQTQIFMETPYRNSAILADILKTCQEGVCLSICADIGSPNAFIASKRISEWKKIPAPDIHKMPAIFCLGRFS